MARKLFKKAYLVKRAPGRSRRLWPLLLAAILMLVGRWDALASDQPDVDVLFDLVPWLAPTKTEKTLTIFGSQDFGPGTACTLTYRHASDGVTASLEILEDRRRIRSLFRSSSAQLTTWWADPALCSPTTAVDRGEDWIKLSVPGPTQGAQFIFIGQDKVTLAIRSDEAFRKRFGSPFFRAETRLYRGNKQNLLAAMKFPRRSLATYESLRLEIDLKLVNATVNIGCVDGIPPPGQAAQQCYDRRKHRTQFRIGFGNVSWQDPRCDRPDPGDPICKYQNRFIQTAFSIYNEAYAFFGGDFHIQRREGRQRIPIYRIDLRDCLPLGTVQNPYQTPGLRTKIQCDLLSGLKKAIFEAERRCHLPPRLKNDAGGIETDDEYLAHYGFAVGNIGFEVTGLADISFDTYAFSLKGSRRQVGVSADGNSAHSSGQVDRRECD